MKNYPVYSNEINTMVLRAGRNGKWTEVHWNDGSISWRRTYRNSDGVNFIINKGITYILKRDEITNRYGFETMEMKAAAKAFEEIKEEIIPEIKTIAKELSNEHPMKKYIKMMVESNIPVYLVGEAGTGKNFTLQKIADELGLDFYYTNSVQDEFKLTGFTDAAGDYHDTEFYRAFVNGGMFFLDELDASIPGVLVLLNAAIANGYFEFPNGKKFANENFRVVAAGNTFGNGADEKYTGRLVLDQASLDRFSVIEFDYYRGIEMELAKDNKDLVDFIEEIRGMAKDLGIRTTFSYRAIQMVTKGEEMKMPMDLIFKSMIFKGFNKDIVRMFIKRGPSNRYFNELARIYG